eukprot:Skav218494  [mRNA]  locus=scaffold538:1365729:1367919:+ [translate_table: standard]
MVLLSLCFSGCRNLVGPGRTFPLSFQATPQGLAHSVAGCSILDVRNEARRQSTRIDVKNHHPAITRGGKNLMSITRQCYGGDKTFVDLPSSDALPRLEVILDHHAILAA